MEAMYFSALATDYDGTIAHDGMLDAQTISGLERLKASGRKLIMVTGRELDELKTVCPRLDLFDLVVAENGALLYDPVREDEILLTSGPSEQLVERLKEAKVPGLSVGRSIIATWEPYETVVLEAIRDLGLELQIIFNKGAVMILPTGVNKATGLRSALKKLGLSRHNTVGIGDAENDEAFLKFCAASAAVDNALEAVKSRVDIVTTGARGAGVTELIDRIIEDDLRKLSRCPKQCVVLGTDLTGNEFRVPVYGTRVLVTGGPAGGKSKFAMAMIEQLMEREYQTCVVDPEGDYHGMTDPIALGTLEQPPVMEEVLEVLNDPDKSCVVSLFGASHEQQPELFAKLLRGIMEYRSRFGRPHWYLIDEAHYPLPAKWEPIGELPLKDLRSVMYITAFIEQLPETILKMADLFIAIGDDPVASLAKYSELLGEPAPEVAPPIDEKEHRALAWWRGVSKPEWFRRLPPKTEHQRHRHGYLEGDMDPEHRFYFRGPEGELNLPAQNLRIFMQVGEGVDDDTWLYHLREGDYGRWFRNVIKDEGLAETAEKLRSNGHLSAHESRRHIFEYIRQKYEKEA
jgi:HAD superfamily hydrolase (TIGR01484 family)